MVRAWAEPVAKQLEAVIDPVDDLHPDGDAPVGILRGIQTSTALRLMHPRLIVPTDATASMPCRDRRPSLLAMATVENAGN